MSPIPDEDKQTLTPQELEGEALDDWRYLAGKLHARFATGNFARGLAMVEQIGAEAEQANHHPDLDLRYTHLHVALLSHDVFGITHRDVRLARTISEIAARVGATSEPGVLQVLDLALDTPDADEIRPFWQAVLGLEPEPSYDLFLFDRDGHVPGLFLQPTDAHEQPRQRWHLDIDVPPDVAQERITKALDAGGTLVTDEHAPAWWVLADPQGNRVCIATWQGRD
jgi:4a-hydroxytetrahydrobiopterin dehydratase